MFTHYVTESITLSHVENRGATPQELLGDASAAVLAPFNGIMCRWEPRGDTSTLVKCREKPSETEMGP